MTDPLGAHALWLTVQDSAFPAGRLVHSNGIESWLRGHPDASADEVVDVVLDVIGESLARLDGVILAHAWVADDYETLIDLDQILLSYKTSENARIASLDPGRTLAQTIRRVGVLDAPHRYVDAVLSDLAPGNLAVVEGVVARAIGIDQSTAVVGMLRGSMAAMLGACVRLGRLGAIGANRALVRAAGNASTAVDEVLSTPVRELRTNTICLDVWAMRHDRYSPRLFAS